MTPPPRSALLLGLAGLIPFFWGALSQVFPALADWGRVALGPRFVGQYVLVFYGTVILSFMSGVLWGFSAKAQGTVAALGYAVSTVPALWAFFFVGGGADRASWFLIAGFVGLLGLDYVFWRARLAPAWWMELRNLLTALVVGSLVVGLIY